MKRTLGFCERSLNTGICIHFDHLRSVVVWGNLQMLRNQILLRAGYGGSLPDRIPQSRVILSRACSRGNSSDLCGCSQTEKGSRCGLMSHLFGGLGCVPISLGSLIGAWVGEICHAPSRWIKFASKGKTGGIMVTTSPASTVLHTCP